jgi:hypothetical protein
VSLGAASATDAPVAPSDGYDRPLALRRERSGEEAVREGCFLGVRQ